MTNRQNLNGFNQENKKTTVSLLSACAFYLDSRRICKSLFFTVLNMIDRISAKRNLIRIWSCAKFRESICLYGMDKRIHRKNGQYLTCRHYLLHFKWPLFGVIFILVSMSAIQINSNLSILNRIHIREEIVFLNDVLYPTHFHDENTVNRSILFYFSRKDELKTADDRQSMAHRQKMVFIENSTNETKKTFLIHEFTPVFGVARFCSTHRDEIFGPSCPYRNW